MSEGGCKQSLQADTFLERIIINFCSAWNCTTSGKHSFQLKYNSHVRYFLLQNEIEVASDCDFIYSYMKIIIRIEIMPIFGAFPVRNSNIMSWDVQQKCPLTFEMTDINVSAMGYVQCMWEVVVMVWEAIAVISWHIACVRRLHVRRHVREPVRSLNALISIFLCLHNHQRHGARYQKL